MVAMMAWLMGYLDMTDLWWPITTIGLVFLSLTGVLLLKDLDRPERFLYVMLRPNWDSWLVKGAYILAAYGGILSATAAVLLFGLDEVYLRYLAYIGIPVSLLTGVYTAWLLQQAKARSWATDKWLPLKFLFETAAIGAATLLLLIGNATIVVVSICALLAFWLHGHQIIEKPQIQALA